MNQTRLERHLFWDWVKAMQEQGIHYFQHKKTGVVVEKFDARWENGKGTVFANRVIPEEPKERPFGFRLDPYDFRICYTQLRPLCPMEVVALCASEA